MIRTTVVKLDRGRLRQGYMRPLTKFLVTTCLFSAVNIEPVAAQSSYAVSNVNVVDVINGQVRSNQTVLVSNGLIQSVETNGSVPAGTTQIDGTGKYLIPGLWDMHVHIRHPAAPAMLFPQFIANGVTGVRDMSSDCNEPTSAGFCIEGLQEFQRNIDAGSLLGPRIVGLSSAPVNPPWDWDGSETEVRETIRTFATRGADLVKMYYRTSPVVFGWIMDEADRVGIEVGGHIPIRMTATEASNLGLRSLEHARDFLFDCFPGSADFRASTRSQNPPMAVMRSMVDDHDVDRCNRTFRSLIRNETWYVPTHVTRRMDAYADDPEFRNDPRAKYIPAPSWQAWQADADRMVALDSTPEGRRVMRGFYEKGLDITGRAHAAGVPIVLGTDAGDTYVFPGSAVHDELGEFIKAGLTPADALASATIRSAQFMRRESEYGSIEPGKYADMVLLDANPLDDIINTKRINTVFVAGQILDRVALDAMLSDVEEAVARF